MAHNPAKTLKDQIWGQDWINAIPAKFRSALKYLNFKTPGVDNSTEPDPIGVDGVINSQVVTNRTNEREKTTSQLDGSVAQHTYHNQEYDEEMDVIVPVDEYLTEEGEEYGEPRRSIEGLTPGIDYVKTISPNTDVLDNYLVYFPGVADIQLPDVLESVSASMDKSSADGSWVETGGASWFGAGSAAISFGGSAEAAAAIMPSVSIRIKQPWAHNIPTTTYLFFMPAPVTAAQVLTKLTTLVGASVVAWPKFKPRMETIRLFGQDKKINARVSSHWQDGGGCADCGDGGFPTGEHSDGTGSGISHAIGLTIKTVSIPPTIHGAIGISGTTSDTVTGSVDASIGSGSVIPVSISDSTTVAGSVASSITATDDDNTIPSTGKRLYRLNVAMYKYRYVKLIAEVVDFADL